MLEARHFIVFTDHKPLIYAFNKKRDKCSPRQFKHFEFISQFTTDIRHISGQDNIVQDALSRVEVITASPTHDTLAAAQDEDNDLKTLLLSGTALQLTKLHIAGTSAEVYCDTSTGKPRPFVHAPLRLQVFESLHSLSHPGIKASAKFVSQRFVWPALQKIYRIWARPCQLYQRSKVSRHTVTPCVEFPIPPARFLYVHMDIIGPLPSSASFQYCLTAVDRFTRWQEVSPFRISLPRP